MDTNTTRNLYVLYINADPSAWGADAAEMDCLAREAGAGPLLDAINAGRESGDYNAIRDDYATRRLAAIIDAVPRERWGDWFGVHAVQRGSNVRGWEQNKLACAIDHHEPYRYSVICGGPELGTAIDTARAVITEHLRPIRAALDASALSDARAAGLDCPLFAPRLGGEWQ